MSVRVNERYMRAMIENRHQFDLVQQAHASCMQAFNDATQCSADKKKGRNRYQVQKTIQLKPVDVTHSGGSCEHTRLPKMQIAHN